MKILVLSNLCPPNHIGGYEIACFNVATALHERGHEVCLATTRSHIPGAPDPSFVARRFSVHWFQPVVAADEQIRRYPHFHASVSDYDNSSELLDLLRAFEPDVVYVWYLFGVGGIAMLDLLNMAGVPWVTHLMDDMPFQLLGAAPPHVRSVFGGTASDLFSHGRAIGISQTLMDEIEAVNGIVFDGGAEIVPGWVDLRHVPARQDYPAAHPVRFVAAGQVVEQKGIGLIIEAAARLRDEGLRAFTVDVFGRGDVPRFVDLAQRLGVQDRVQFRGGRTQAELLAIYPRYHAFLFPTWEREPFGFAPIEAAACGCIPIITRQCGVAERLIDAAHCFKIDRTVDELTEAMRTVITAAVDLPAMSRRASDMVRRDLAFESILPRIEGILQVAAQTWDRSRLDDPRLPLLLHTKHHLALSMMFG